MLLCEDLWHPSTAYIAAMDRALTLLVPVGEPDLGARARQSRPRTPRYWQRSTRVYAPSRTACTSSTPTGSASRTASASGAAPRSSAPSGEVLAQARYYEPDLIVAEINLGARRRKRIAAPMLRDENLDLTINELIAHPRPRADGGACAAGAEAARSAAPRPPSAQAQTAQGARR